MSCLAYFEAELKGESPALTGAVFLLDWAALHCP